MKIKMQFYITLLLSFICTFCASSYQNQKLVHTQWYIDFGNDRQDCFTFLDSMNYKFYDAEIADTTLGTYSFKNDTIFLNQEYGIYESGSPKDSEKRTEKKKFKMILINENQLGFIENWDEKNNKWKEKFYFTKRKK